MLTSNVHHFFCRGPRCVGFNQCFKHSGTQGRSIHQQVAFEKQKRHCTSVDCQRMARAIWWQILKKLKSFMTTTVHEPESFPYWIIFDHVQPHQKTGKVLRCEWVIGVYVVQDQNRLGNKSKEDHLINLLTVKGANLLSE